MGVLKYRQLSTCHVYSGITNVVVRLVNERFKATTITLLSEFKSLLSLITPDLLLFECLYLCTQCLLVQGYPASTTWGFPKGKLEEGENDIDAAVREMFEETGYDSRGIIREDWFLEAQVNGSEAKMYVIPGVPDNTHFEPKTRKEIRVSHVVSHSHSRFQSFSQGHGLIFVFFFHSRTSSGFVLTTFLATRRISPPNRIWERAQTASS